MDDKKIEWNEESLEKLRKEMSKVYEVFDPDTGEVIFVGHSLECCAYLWDHDGPKNMWNARRNKYRMREATAAGKILYGRNS